MRIICFVFPRNFYSVNEKYRTSSISIIGMCLYNIFFEYKPSSVFLYTDDLEVLEDDVLLILSTINLLDEDVLKKYKHVAYFFDDIYSPLSSYDSEKYHYFLNCVQLFFHPRREQVVKLNLDPMCTFKVLYKPWAADDAVNGVCIKKTVEPSILLDIDIRPKINSLKPSINFYKSCDERVLFYIPEIARLSFESISKGNIIFIPHCPRGDYIDLLGSVWAYATAINSSYEFSVLEASCLGTGLISIDDAIADEHKKVNGFLHFDSSSNAQTVFDFLESIPFDVVKEESVLKYSKESCMTVVDEILNFKW